MTKEDVLQKANDYCNEKSYTETLTEDFRNKFAEFFAKKYPDTEADDEAATEDLKFNLNTAFSAASKSLTSKQEAFDTKKTELEKQIAALKKKLGKKDPDIDEPKIPEEIQSQLDELRAFRNEEKKKAKFANILALAKKGVREDLHKSFETFANGTDVSLDKEDKEQADALVTRFQEIFKDTIGVVKPLAPRHTEKQDAEYINSLPKVKVQ